MCRWEQVQRDIGSKYLLRQRGLEESREPFLQDPES